MIQGAAGNGLTLPSHPGKYAGLFGSVYAAAAAGFPGAAPNNHLDAAKQPPQSMGPMTSPGDLKSGSLLFQATTSPGPHSPPGQPWPGSVEPLRHHHHHHYERELQTAAPRPESAGSPPRLPAPQGLAA